MDGQEYRISAVARHSGLSVSALRFYANNGLLAPARVDERTGYRWYTEGQLRTAELLAALRRAGMPLAESARLLERRDDPAAAAEILQRQLRRTQQDLATTRASLDQLRPLLDLAEADVDFEPTWLDVDGAELGAALNAVRFAVRADSPVPALRGVLLDIRADAVTLIATDRHRLAVASARVHELAGKPTTALVPTALFERCAVLLSEHRPVTLRVDGGQISLRVGSRVVSAPCLVHEYPDYQRVLRSPSSQQVEVDVPRLRRELHAAPARRVRGARISHVSVLAVHPDRTLTVERADGAVDGARLRIGVDRDYLLEACAALRCERVSLGVDGPTTPLTFRPAGADEPRSLLMPFRIDGC